ncbi:hypothetical protein C8034_v004358 [Colletotrichum sidae]|uniref:Uncharacterized protein n=1 Tax=Colletotrichum sidae TaxID=1347389 RepID=A0A4R8TA49_9PEZI|nr:hypothetical protein C8034_v004358 [Colletotrichum sidae]
MAASLRRSHNGNDLSLRRNFAYRPRRLFRRQGWLRISARRVSAHQPWNYAAKRTTARLGWAGPDFNKRRRDTHGRTFLRAVLRAKLGGMSVRPRGTETETISPFWGDHLDPQQRIKKTKRRGWSPLDALTGSIRIVRDCGILHCRWYKKR